MAWSNPVGSVVEPSANGQTVAVPLSVSAGRLYVVALSFGGTTDPPPVTPPADFTWTVALAPTRNSGQNLAIYYRVLTGAEGSTATWSVGAAAVSYQAAVAYSDSTVGWGATPLALVSSLATDSTLTTPSIANMPSSGGLAITCWSVSNGATGVASGTPFWTSSDVTIVADAAQTATASRPVALGYEAAPAAGQTYPAQSASSAGLTLDTITAAMIFVEGAAGSAQTAILYAAGAPTPSGFDVTAEFADTALTNANMRLKTATDAAFTANVATHTSVTSVNAPTASPTYKIARATASGLSANTTYYYIWETWSGSAWVQTSGGNGKIKTRPADNAAASFVLAAASCSQHAAADDSAAFTQVDTLDPDYAMWLGDFFYENTVDRYSTDVERYRGDWREPLKDQPNRRTLLGNRGLLHVMGDHDATGNGANKDTAGWAQAHQVAREMIPQFTPHYSDVYTQTFQIGRVHFFMLDAYSYRSAPVTTAGGYTNAQIDAAIIDPTRTMLGSRQLADFKAWLLAHADAAKVVVSPVGWHSIGRTQEDWSNYKYEQDQIAAYVSANNIRNTVVLCGDMHACAWDSGNNTAASWPVMHAAPWHQTASHKGGTYDKGEIPAPPDTSLVEQFGLLSFTDTGGDDISLTFSARDATNTNLFTDSVMTFTDVEGVSSTVETMAPVATRNITASMTPNTDPAATAAVDDDPDASDGVLIANSTDPSGSSGSSNNNYADASAAASGIATQLTNPANAVGSSEATTSASAGVQNTDWATFFTFDETTLAAAVPSNAVITSFNATLRDSLSNVSRGTVGVRFDTTNGTQLAAENTTNPSTSLPATGTGRTVTPATLPTRAQLVASTFGVRVRYRRTASQAATYTLDWIRINISYTTPGSTVNTHVELIMDNPDGELETGTDTGFVKVRVAKRGTGPNPTCSVRVMEFMGGTTWTERAAPASMTNVAIAGGAVLSGFFDQVGIANKDNVEVWIDGTGTAGALVEFDGARWDATMQAVAGQTLNATGIASAEVIGSPALNRSMSITGITSAEVLGSPSLSQSLAPTGITSQEALGQPTLNQSLAPSGITSAQALGQPGLNQSTSPAGIASQEVMGQPVLNQTVAPSGIASAEAIGQPVLNQVLAPTGIASQETMGAPSLSAAAGSQNLAVSGIASQEALGQPVLNRTVDLNSGLIPDTGLVPDVGLAPDAYEGIGSEQTIGRPSLTQSAPAGNTLNITGIASQEAVGSPTLNQTLSPSSIGTQEALGGPALAQRISPTGIASQEVTGQPGLNQQVSVQGIASEEMTGQPSLTYPQSLQVSGIASQEAIGSPALDQAGNPNQNLQITGIASAESVGQPGLSQTVAPSGIASGESIGQPGLIQDQSLQVSGIPSSEAVGQPTIHLRVNATGIASQEVLGSVSLTQGEPPAGLPLVVLGIPSGETIGVPVVWLGDVPLPPGPITGTVGFDPNMKSTVSAAIALGGSNVGRQLVGKVNVQRPVKHQVRVDDLNSNESYNSGGG